MGQPMKRTFRQFGRRTKVAVVYEDVTAGFRWADWLALHGYQATVASAAAFAEHQLERDLREFRPDVIVVGTSPLSESLDPTLPRLKSTCPQVPIIAMVKSPTDRRGDGDSLNLPQPLSPDVFFCHSLDPLLQLAQPVSPSSS